MPASRPMATPATWASRSPRPPLLLLPAKPIALVAPLDGALFAAPAVPKPPVVWRLSRPNRALQRTRGLMVQTFARRSMITSPHHMAVTGASLSSVR